MLLRGFFRHIYFLSNNGIFGYLLRVQIIRHIFLSKGSTRIYQILRLTPRILRRVLRSINMAIGLRRKITILLIYQGHLMPTILISIKSYLWGRFRLIRSRRSIARLLILNSLQFLKFIPRVFLYRSVRVFDISGYCYRYGCVNVGLAGGCISVY